MEKVSLATKEFYLDSIRKTGLVFNNPAKILDLDGEVSYLNNSKISNINYLIDYQFICDYVYANYFRENLSERSLIAQINLNTLDNIFEKIIIKPLFEVISNEEKRKVFFNDVQDCESKYTKGVWNKEGVSPTAYAYMLSIIQSTCDGKNNLIKDKTNKWLSEAQKALEGGFNPSMLILIKSQLGNLVATEMVSTIDVLGNILKYLNQINGISWKPR